MSGLHSATRIARSRSCRLALTAGSGALALALAVLAARHVAESPWPLSRGHPGLLVAAALLSLLGYGLKAYGWQRLIPRAERPRSLALAAASGGASISGLVLPGRFDDVVRIAIVRRYPGCPTGIRTLCLSLFMLGLIDTVALAPLAGAAAVLPGQAFAARIGLAVIAGAGLGAALLILGLPRLLASRRFLPLRLGRWLRPRTTSFREAVQAWALVSTCWVMRAAGVVLLLGTLGVGFSLPLALLFLCASSAAAALPIGPGGAATQAGAGAAVLITSGAGASEAVAVAIAVQALGIIAGGSILLFAAAWRTSLWLATRISRAPLPVHGLGVIGVRASEPL